MRLTIPLLQGMALGVVIWTGGTYLIERYPPSMVFGKDAACKYALVGTETGVPAMDNVVDFVFYGAKKGAEGFYNANCRR